MWHRVWGAASCLALLSFACGKSERGPADESSGTAGRTTNGGSSAGGSGSSAGGSGSVAGTSGSGGAGASVSAGGMSPALGGSQAMGGMNVALGGEPAEAGEAGASTAGGAPGCDGYYHACGCGCCGSPASPATCVYPDLGQDLSEARAQDLARRADQTSCAAVGCSLGQDYFCCAAAPPSEDGATYDTSLFVGDIGRIRLYEYGTSCSTFTLQQRYPADPEDPRAFPVEVPAGWKIETITTLPCISSATGPKAIGAIGKFSLRVLENSCVVDAHLTAFFSNDKRELDTVRFDADAVPVDISVAECK